jgi:diguanylate cyclase (GGDEF)-like protein
MQSAMHRRRFQRLNKMKTMEKNIFEGKKIWLVLKIILTVFVIIFLSTAVYLCSQEQRVDNKLINQSIISLDDKWQKIPTETINGKKTYAYEYKITDDIDNGNLLSLKNYTCNFTIYVDNEEIYSFDNPSYSRGCFRHWIFLPDNIAGKTLKITSTENAFNLRRTILSGCCIGDPVAVEGYYIKSNAYAVVISSFLIFLSIISVVVGLSLRHSVAERQFLSIENLAGFIISAGIWVVCDSQFFQLYTDNSAIIALIRNIAFILTPFFLCMFMNDLFINKSNALKIVYYLYSVELILYTANLTFNIMPTNAFVFVSFFLDIIAMVIILHHCFYEIKVYKNKEIKLLTLGLCILFLLSTVSFLLYFFDPGLGYAYFFSGGIIIFTISMIITAFSRVFYYVAESANTKAYKQLAFTDTMTLLGNRAAFEKYTSQENKYKKLAYIIFDVNNLKTVNDKYGHSEGDNLIKDAAKCIKNVFERMGHCYRIGGDEFLAIIENVSAKEIENELKHFENEQKKINKNRSFPLQIAYGFAIKTDKSISDETLFNMADDAMYEKKKIMKKENKIGV